MLEQDRILDFARVTVFALMLLNGIAIPLPRWVGLLRMPGLLLRSVLAAVFVVPATAAAILWL